MKIFSEIKFSDEKRINNIKSIVKNIFSLIKSSFEENVFKKTRKIIEIKIEVNPTSIKEVFIFSFFLSEVGRYLIKLFPSPKRPKLEINVITEIRVVAIPTCSGLNNLALIIQKKNPKKAITKVLAIK